MLSDTISERYAEALFLFGKERGLLADLDRELQAAQALIDSHPRLAHAYEAPYVPHSVKMLMVRRVLKGRASPPVVNFFMLLIEKGRTHFRKAIIRKFQELREDSEGFIKCSVEAAYPLGDALKAEIEAWIAEATGRKPLLAVTVDPDLVAGVVIRIKDRFIDLSVGGLLKSAAGKLLKAS